MNKVNYKSIASFKEQNNTLLESAMKKLLS